MRNKTIYAFCALLAAICWGCSPSTPATPAVTPNANSFVVSGGPYLNSLFNSGTFTNDSGAYNETLNLTRGIINWHTGTPSVSVQINFKGNKTGVFTLGPTSLSADTNAVNIISMSSSSGTSEFLSQAGTLTVTEYDAVGGIIKGSFSGNFFDASMQEYTITNGAFSEIRAKDTH